MTRLKAFGALLVLISVTIFVLPAAFLVSLLKGNPDVDTHQNH